MKQLHRWKLYFDKDLEESWLNQLAQQGWGLTSFCLGRYTFEPIEPGEYIYRVDLLPSDEEKKQEVLLPPARDGGGGRPAVGLLVFLPPPRERGPLRAVQRRALQSQPLRPHRQDVFSGCAAGNCLRLSFRYPPSSPETARIDLAAMVLLLLLGAVLLRQGLRFQRKQKEQQS